MHILHATIMHDNFIFNSLSFIGNVSRLLKEGHLKLCVPLSMKNI